MKVQHSKLYYIIGLFLLLHQCCTIVNVEIVVSNCLSSMSEMSLVYTLTYSQKHLFYYARSEELAVITSASGPCTFLYSMTDCSVPCFGLTEYRLIQSFNIVLTYSFTITNIHYMYKKIFHYSEILFVTFYIFLFTLDQTHIFPRMTVFWKKTSSNLGTKTIKPRKCSVPVPPSPPASSILSSSRRLTITRKDWF